MTTIKHRDDYFEEVLELYRDHDIDMAEALKRLAGICESWYARDESD